MKLQRQSDCGSITKVRNFNLNYSGKMVWFASCNCKSLVLSTTKKTESNASPISGLSYGSRSGHV